MNIYDAAANQIIDGASNDLYWKYDTATYTLTFYGAGAMADYSLNNLPEWSHYRVDKIVWGGALNVPATSTSTVKIHGSSVAGMKLAACSTGITHIGNYAFYDNDRLTAVTLPTATATTQFTLGDYAFAECDGIASITIPAKVTGIGTGTFRNDKGMTTLLFANASSCETIGASAFEGCSNLITLKGNGVANTLPLSVIHVGANAFCDCEGLSAIAFQNKLQTIGAGAFKNCVNITSLTFIGTAKAPSVCTKIGDSAFENCLSLKTLQSDGVFDTFPASVSTIGRAAFYGCSELSGGTLSSGTPFNKADVQANPQLALTNRTGISSIGFEAFTGCSSLENIKLYNGACTIEDGAFDYDICLWGVVGSPVESYAAEREELGTFFMDVYGNSSAGTKKITISNVEYTIVYELKMPSKATLDANNNTCVITSIKMPSGGTALTIPDSFTISFSVDELAAMGITAKAAQNRVVAVVGIGDIHEMNLWDKFTMFFKNLFHIEDSIFEGEFRPNSVTLPAYLKTVGNNAFHDVETIQAVIIKGGSWLEEIGPYAFYRTGIESLTIPAASVKLQEIPEYAFANCSSLGTVKILTPNITYIGNHAFADCGTKLDVFQLDCLNVNTMIEESAFDNDEHLSTVTLGNAKNTGVLTVGGENMFDDAHLVTLAINCGTIEDNGAFQNLKYLGTVTFGANLTALPDGIFKGSSLGQNNITEKYTCQNCGYEHTTTTIPESCTQCGKKTDEYEGRLFEAEMTAAGYNVILPAGLTSIGAEAFKDCQYLQSVGVANNVTGTLPGNLVEIGESAFEGCSWLKNIVIPKTVTEIPKSAFKNCERLTMVSFANGHVNPANNAASIRTIGESAFEGCFSLTTIKSGTTNDVFPASLTTIESRAFYGCESLCSLDTAKGTLTSGIAVAAKAKNETDSDYHDRQLANVTGLQYIGQDAFKECLFLMNIKLYNGNCDIADTVFDSGVFIWSVTGSDVNAYADARASKDIFFIDIYGGNNDKIVDGASGDLYWRYESATGILTFYGAGRMADYTEDNLPEWHRYSVTKIVWGPKFTVPASSTVKIHGNSVAGTTIAAAAPTHIGNYAFYECKRLSAVTVPVQTVSIGDYAFNKCANLRTANLNTANLETIGQYAFAECYDSDGRSKFTITANGTAAIGSAKMKKIGAHAFEGIAVKVLTVNAATIDESAFESCYQMTQLTLNSVALTSGNNTVGKRAFANEEKLLKLIVNSPATANAKINLYPSAFAGNKALKTVQLGNRAGTEIDMRQASDVFEMISNWFAGEPESEQLFADSPIESLTINAAKLYYDEKEVKSESDITDDEIALEKRGPFAKKDSLKTVTLASLTAVPEGFLRDDANLGEIVIPNTVTEIGNYAFTNCQGLSKITMSSNLTKIGNYAFMNCSGITKMPLGSKLQSIGDYAFYGCSTMRTVVGKSNNYLPDTLTIIGEAAFYNSGITTLTSGASTPNTAKEPTRALDNRTGLQSIGSRAFGMCQNLINIKLYNGSCKFEGEDGYGPFDANQVLYSVVDSPAESYANSHDLIFVDIYNTAEKLETGTIPEVNLKWTYSRDTGALTIAPISTSAKAYVMDESISSDKAVQYYIPDFTDIRDNTGNNHNKVARSVTHEYANKSAPWNTYKIVSVTINGSPSSIGDYAFYNCEVMSKFSVPSTVQRIGYKAFANNSQLNALTIAGSAALSIEDFAFTNDPLSTTKTLGTRPLSIGAYAFANLKSPTLTFTATHIGPHAFKNCYNLETLTVNGANTAIEAGAFEACLALNTINLKSTGDCSLSSTSFVDDVYIQTLVINGGAKANWSVKEDADREANQIFEGAYLSALTLDCKLDDTFDGAFANLDALQTVTLGANINQIPAHMFENDVLLTKLTINSVIIISIGDSAFKGCTGLSSVKIPRDVAIIGNSAFEDCTGLTTVVFNGAKCEVIGDMAFKNCESLTQANTNNILPASLKTIGREAFYGTLLPYIQSGSKQDVGCVTEIGIDAFANCPEFTYATLYGSDITFGNNKAFDDYTIIYGYVNTPLERYVKGETNWVFIDITRMATEVFTGRSGDLTWVYTPKTGNLTFKGKGRMADYASRDEIPWLNYKIVTVNFANGQTNIGSHAFDGCEYISKVVTTATITSIGQSAFEGCTRIKAFIIPAAVTSVDGSAFKDCTALETVTFTATSKCTILGDSAFEGCTSLKYTVDGSAKEYIPVSIKTIGSKTFYGCESLTAMRSGRKDGEGLKTVGSQAFTGCKMLYSIYLWNGMCQFANDSVDYDIVVYSVPYTTGLKGWCDARDVLFIDIRDKAAQAAITGFSGDLIWTYDVQKRSLTFTIPRYVKKNIVHMENYTSPEAAPWAKFKIKDVIFPNKLNEIGDYAFTNHKSLLTVSCPKTVTHIGNYAFYGCHNLDLKAKNFIEVLAARTVPVSFGEKALILTPRVYEQGELAGMPEITVSQSVKEVNEIDEGGAQYNDELGKDGIAKVDVKFAAEEASGDFDSGKDYVLLIDNTPSMNDHSFCANCGACLTAGTKQHDSICNKCGAGKILDKGKHFIDGCDGEYELCTSGYEKTMWKITQERADEFVRMILEDNPHNRVALLTMKYREISYTRHDSKSVTDPEDLFTYTSYGTQQCKDGVDFAYLVADFTNNVSTLRTAINTMKTGAIYNNVAYQMTTWHWEGPWEWSGRPASPPDPNAPKGDSGGGGGGGNNDGPSEPSPKPPSPPSHVEASIKDVINQEPAVKRHDKFIDFTPMQVSAATYGTDYTVGQIGSILTANRRGEEYNTRPVDFVFISDGRPESHRNFAKATGAVTRHFFDWAFTMGLVTTDEARTYLQSAASLAKADVTVDINDDGVDEVIVEKGKPLTFMVNKDRMERVFHKYLSEIYGISNSKVNNVVLSSVLNTELWHVIKTPADIEGNEDGHISIPRKYMLSKDLKVSDNGSVITRDYGNKSIGTTSFSYYIQLNESERYSGQYSEKKDDLLVTNDVHATYSVLGGTYDGTQDKAENHDPHYLWWKSYVPWGIRYVVNAGEDLSINVIPTPLYTRGETAIVKHLKDLTKKDYPAAYDECIWTTSPSGRGGTPYTPGSPYTMPESAFAVNGVRPSTLPTGVTWNEKYNCPVLTLYLGGISDRVYYDGLVENVQYFGHYDDTTEHYVNVQTGSYINTNPTQYYTHRLGWDFMGWTKERATIDIIAPNTYVKTPLETVVYAAYKRDLKLQLRSDTFDYVPMDSTGVIYNLTDTFEFNDSEFKAATTCGDGIYKVTFEKNGESNLTDIGSLVIDENNQVDVPVHFTGWYSALSGGQLLGQSGTAISVKTYEGQPYKYTVTGDAGHADMESQDRTLTIYAQHDSNYLRLPGCERNTGNIGNGKSPDLFIGWFTKPQPENGIGGDGGTFIGKAGDVVRVSKNLVLYPWFNIAPTMITSAIGEDVQFYEGQTVTYSQLMTLVDAWDVDNPEETMADANQISSNDGVSEEELLEAQVPGLVNYSGVNVWTTMCHLQVESFLHDTYPTMSDDEIKAIADRVNYDIFVPKLIDIEYARNGKDPRGNAVSDSIAETQEINGNEDTKLNTKQKYLGDVVLHYQITDNGTFANGVQIMTGVVSPGGKIYTMDSPITVDFYLNTVINFNNLPRIVTSSAVAYTRDENINASTIEKFLLDKQDAVDACDDRDYKPWWYKAETAVNLDNSLRIVKISNITFSSGFMNEHSDVCAKVSVLTDIKQLFKLKDGTSSVALDADMQKEAFDHITSFIVEFDCVDQWGKKASGRYGEKYGVNDEIYGSEKYDETDTEPFGMHPMERSIVVTMFNNEDDYDLLMFNATVAERMRYIDAYWADQLQDNSYWGSFIYGRSKLSDILNRHNTGTPHSTYNGTAGNGLRDVPITINDYD